MNKRRRYLAKRRRAWWEGFERIFNLHPDYSKVERARTINRPGSQWRGQQRREWVYRPISFVPNPRIYNPKGWLA